MGAHPRTGLWGTTGHALRYHHYQSRDPLLLLEGQTGDGLLDTQGRTDRRRTPRHARLLQDQALPTFFRANPHRGTQRAIALWQHYSPHRGWAELLSPRQGDNWRHSPWLKCCLRLALSCLFFWAGTGIKRSSLLCQQSLHHLALNSNIWAKSLLLLQQNQDLLPLCREVPPGT